MGLGADGFAGAACDVINLCTDNEGAADMGGAVCTDLGGTACTIVGGVVCTDLGTAVCTIVGGEACTDLGGAACTEVGGCGRGACTSFGGAIEAGTAESFVLDVLILPVGGGMEVMTAALNGGGAELAATAEMGVELNKGCLNDVGGDVVLEGGTKLPPDINDAFCPSLASGGNAICGGGLLAIKLGRLPPIENGDDEVVVFSTDKLLLTVLGGKGAA